MTNAKNSQSLALTHLKLDQVLSGLIHKYGPLEYTHTPDLFPDILSTIIGQQLSTKVADIIEDRFLSLFPQRTITPEILISLPDQTIRNIGVSYSKISYLKNLASATLNGELNLNTLPDLPDDQVILELTKIKGIGPWTAEMILMFSMNRPDVFSLGDLGLRTAISKLYAVDRDDLKPIAVLSLKWSRHRTLASRYLWKSLDQK